MVYYKRPWPKIVTNTVPPSTEKSGMETRQYSFKPILGHDAPK